MIEVRSIDELPELREAVRIQKLIWNFDDVDLLPVRLFVVAGKVGGQTMAAFDGDKMVGFLLSIPGIKKGSIYLHSHMMGVLEEYRNAGAGRAMKLAQRTEALSREVKLVEWTFDPLQLKNAFFNIERLGAVVRRYVLNQYGVSSSPLQAGLPTDRCIVEWALESRRVNYLVDGAGSYQRPNTVAKIPVLNTISEIAKKEPARALELQSSISEQFMRHFTSGLAVTGLERGETESSYLLAPWEGNE